MKFTLEGTREDDDRWLAEVPQLCGAVAYGESEAAARTKAQARALRILAEQLEAGSCAPFDMSMSIIPVRSANDPHPDSSPPADQVAYDAWLAAKVQEALADESAGIPHEEAMRMVRAALAAK